MSGAARRTVTVKVAAGSTSSYYIEMPIEREPPAVGRLEIVSDPPGAQVTVDGVARGAAPLAVGSLPAGEHTVTIAQNGAMLHRKVTVAAGATASVVASGIAGAGAAGWVSINAPFDMNVLERGSQIGTTASRIMVPAGPHRFDLVNSDLEYTTTISVTVGAGATATATVTPPIGSLSVNALPWADVFVDGKPAGTTPLGNLAVPVGSHEVIWRHPQFGERRRTVTVKPNTPARVGVDFHQ